MIFEFILSSSLENTTHSELISRLIRKERHCVKSVLIRTFSGLYFPAFGLNTERYRESLRDTEYLSVFSPNAGKYGLEILRIRTLFRQ